MRGTAGPDSHKPFVEKVVEHLHGTVGGKIAVLMDRQGRSEGEAAEAVARLRASLEFWAPEGPRAAALRQDEGR